MEHAPICGMSKGGLKNVEYDDFRFEESFWAAPLRSNEIWHILWVQSLRQARVDTLKIQYFQSPWFYDCFTYFSRHFFMAMLRDTEKTAGRSNRILKLSPVLVFLALWELSVGAGAPSALGAPGK